MPCHAHYHILEHIQLATQCARFRTNPPTNKRFIPTTKTLYSHDYSNTDKCEAEEKKQFGNLKSNGLIIVTCVCTCSTSLKCATSPAAHSQFKRIVMFAMLANNFHIRIQCLHFHKKIRMHNAQRTL